jgi:hypothetical protein
MIASAANGSTIFQLGLITGTSLCATLEAAE